MNLFKKCIVGILSTCCLTLFAQTNDETIVRKYLRDIPPHYSDEQAIDGLKNLKVTDRAKKLVDAGTACLIRRFDLAIYMINENYRNLGSLDDVFSTPFSDGPRNNIMISNNFYSDKAIIDYLKAFMKLNTPVDEYVLHRLYGDPAKKLIYDFVYSNAADSVTLLFDQSIFITRCNDPKSKISELEKLLKTTKAKVSKDIMFIIPPIDVEHAAFYIANGAVVANEEYEKQNSENYHPINSAIYSGNTVLISYYLDNGLDVCRKRNQQYIHEAAKIKKQKWARNRIRRFRRSRSYQKRLNLSYKILKKAFDNCSK